jgi:translation initiation factor 2 beta subunit (eIF-2beta)/eIF-5
MQTFSQMLNDVYSQLGTSKSDTFILPNPELDKGTTRVVWKNAKTFLKRTQTPPDHLFEFILRESGKKINWFSDSVSDGIIFHEKKISDNDIISLMKKYVDSYVICKICKNSETSMYRDTEIKKYRIKCTHCNSEYTVTV